MPIVITYTLQAVTATDMNQIVIRPGNVAGEIIANGYFDVKDAGGVVREQGSVSVNLNPAQKTALISFINANIVPAFNSQRGL
jgi:hypothetical protein